MKDKRLSVKKVNMINYKDFILSCRQFKKTESSSSLLDMNRIRDFGIPEAIKLSN